MTDQVKFGADASEYFDVAARMQETIDRLAAKAEQSGGRHEAASGKYLESTRRVRRELGELAQDFAESGDAADLLTSGIGRISEVLKIGLGPGIAASVGVAVFEVINKQIEAARKLHEEIESITSEQGGGEFRGFDSIDKHISDIKAKLDELKISSTSTGRQLSHLALDCAVGGVSGGIAYGHSAKDDRAQILADEAKINAAQIADLNAIAQREEINEHRSRAKSH